MDQVKGEAKGGNNETIFRISIQIHFFRIRTTD